MLLVPLFWGGAFGATKHVLTELPPFTAATVRFGMAAILLVVWLTWRKGWNLRVIKERWKGLLVLSLTGIFAYNAFFFIGLQYTSAANGSLVIAMNPVSTTLIALLFLGESWSRRLGLGVTISFLGCLTVISGGSWETIRTLSFNTGDLLLLISVASWSLYSTVGKSVMKGVPPLLATTVTTVVGTGFLALGTITEGGWARLPDASMQTWLELFYMAAFATVLGFVLFNLGVHRIGASKAAAYINLVPPNAILIAVFLYGDTLHWAQLAGAALVISGVLLTTRAPQKKQPAAPSGTAKV